MAEKLKFWRVSNYDAIDHYKNGKPMRWIKADVQLADSEVMALFQNDRDKWRLFRLFLLAGSTGNRIPAYDGGKFLRKNTGILPKFRNELQEIGILVEFFDHPDSSIFSRLPKKLSRESLAREREGEADRDKDKEGKEKAVDGGHACNDVQYSRRRIGNPLRRFAGSPIRHSGDFDVVKRKVKTAWQIEAQRDPDSIARNSNLSVRQVREALKQLRNDGELT